MNTRKIAALSAAVAVVGGLVGAAGADPLTFTRVSAASTAAQLSDKYGVNVILKGDYGRKPVYATFTLDDADTPDARLNAVNMFANSIGADYTKTYVISNGTGGTSAVPIDSTATIPFPKTKMSAKDAINLIAAADHATAKIVGDMSGTVTLPDTSMTVGDAATEIAKQTHTRWKAFYVLTPRGAGRVLNGKVIGYTNAGSPITELPSVSFSTPRPPVPDQDPTQQANADTQDPSQVANDPNAAMNNGQYGYNPYADNYNAYAYNYNPYSYSYNPYASGAYGGGFGYGNPYGDAGSGYGYGGPGFVFGNGGGFNGGGVFSPGSGVIFQGGSPYGYGNPFVFGNSGY